MTDMLVGGAFWKKGARAALAVFVLGAVLGAVTGKVAFAAGDSWFQTGNYLRTDGYNTDFYAQGATWWDPIDNNNIYVWRTYLRMDIVDFE